MTFGSLFAGAGGFDLGFERAGMKCKWQVEIDPFCRQVLAKHWPDVERHDDVRTFKPRADQWVDVICFGFPCQDISLAGTGAGLAGARSGLFFEALRVVAILRPRWVVVENVAALLNRGLDAVLGELAKVGYDAEWHCIQAADFGAPHIRDRIFIVGHVSDPNGCEQGWRDISERSPHQRVPDTPGDGQAQSLADSEGQGLEGERNSGESSGESSGEYARSGLIRGAYAVGGEWPVEPAVGELVDGVSGGVVRFAGRTADGTKNRSDKLRCLGNAVVPQIAFWIAKRIMEHA